jgi:hypothetical protein
MSDIIPYLTSYSENILSPTAEDMKIPNLDETLPSFLTEYYWGSFLKSLYDQEHIDFLFEIYRRFGKIYPDQPNYADILTNEELDDIFSGIAKIIGHDPNYKFLTQWGESLSLTNFSEEIRPLQKEKEKLLWRINDIETIAYRRKYYGSFLGYEMIFSSLRRSGSVFLVGEYPSIFNKDYKRKFRIIDNLTNYKFLPTSNLALINEHGLLANNNYSLISGYIEGLVNIEDYENQNQTTILAHDGSQLVASFSNKTIVLDISLDSILNHTNTFANNECLLDLAWLDYVYNNALSAKRITENVKVGAQLNIVVDTSGFYSKKSQSKYTHNDTHTRAFVFNNNYSKNSDIYKIRLGTGGESKLLNGWFRSIDDISALPLFGASIYDYTKYIDPTQLKNREIDDPGVVDSSGFDVEFAVFESSIDNLEIKKDVYDDYDYVNSMVYSENIQNLKNASTKLSIIPMFLDSTIINDGQTDNTSMDIGKISFDFIMNPFDYVTERTLLDKDEVSSGSFVIGRSYVISVPGDTDFISVHGASNNDIGTIFTAQSAGSGLETGKAYNMNEAGNLTQTRINQITSIIDLQRKKITPGSVDCMFVLSPNFIEASTKITKIIQTNANKDYTYNYGITTPGPVINVINENSGVSQIDSGKTYEIVTVGTTDYTAFGSQNNNQGTIFTASFPSVTITGSSRTGSTATLDFEIRAIKPFPVGSKILVSGVGAGTGIGTYNGEKIVTSSTAYSVSFSESIATGYYTGTAILSGAFGNGSVYDIGVHNIVAGKVYKILYSGTNASLYPFTNIGASSNLVGEIFKSTGTIASGSGAVQDLGTPLVISDVTSFEQNFWIDNVVDEVNPFWQYVSIKDIYNNYTKEWEQHAKILKKKKINMISGESYYDWEDITDQDEAHIKIEKSFTYYPTTGSTFRYILQNKSFINYDKGIVSFLAINNLSYDNYADYLLPIRTGIYSSNKLYVSYANILNTSDVLRAYSILGTFTTEANVNNFFIDCSPETYVSNIDSISSGSFIIGDSYKILFLENTSFNNIGAEIITSGSFKIGTEYAIKTLGSTPTAFEDIGSNLVTVGKLVKGKEYIIKDPGDSDFTLSGALSNTAGTIFIATNSASGNGTTGKVYEILFIANMSGEGNGTAYKTIFTASAVGSGSGSASRSIRPWVNNSTYNFINNCTKNLADLSDKNSSIVGITEMALFNKNDEIVFYSYFPPVIYDSEKNHMSFNVFIKKSSITV